MKKILVLILLVSIDLEADSEIRGNRVPYAGSKVVEAVISKLMQKEVPEDSISGNCSYKGGSCSGAQVEILDGEKLIHRVTITSPTQFKVPNLKKGISYKLKLTWDKHAIEEVRSVRTGEFIDITLQ